MDPTAAAAVGGGGGLLSAYLGTKVLDQAGFKQSTAATLDQILNLITARLALAVLIAVLGRSLAPSSAWGSAALWPTPSLQATAIRWWPCPQPSSACTSSPSPIPRRRPRSFGSGAATCKFMDRKCRVRSMNLHLHPSADILHANPGAVNARQTSQAIRAKLLELRAA